MLFNSLTFAIFLPLVFFAYWALAPLHYRWQNLFLVAASYVFYGWWDWRFLLLLCFSSTMDYGIGRLLGEIKTQKRRKMLIIASIVLNIGLLGFFKYYNFFIGSFVELGQKFGFQMHASTLSVILPLGLSFYTFQSLGYTLDVYKKKLLPARNLVDFQAYVSFFPQLVAGPIERAGHMLPQFQNPRNFDLDAAKDGMRQMLWGLFKKIVIADNCAVVVNKVFANPDIYPASARVVGLFCFAMQIYGDFSGYSDIALGCARLFGIKLMRNFAFPFFSRNIAEFWRRWNISIMSWFRDYVYAPMTRIPGSRWKVAGCMVITFLISGLWHGANWTFIFWGLLNGLYLVPQMVRKRRWGSQTAIVASGRLLPSPIEALQMLGTFSLVMVTAVFFRAPSVSAAFHYLGGIFQRSLFSIPSNIGLMTAIPLVSIMLLVEWLQRDRQHGLEMEHVPRGFRWAGYYAVGLCIVVAGGDPQSFIYFQF